MSQRTNGSSRVWREFDWTRGRSLACGAALAGLCLASPVFAQSDADAKLTAPEQTNQPPAGIALEKALKGIKADGPFKLTDAVQADLFALLPAARRGEECPSPATVAPDAQVLKDRGDGAQLIAQLTNCQGSFLMIYAPGEVQRVARLLDLEEGQALGDAHAMNLRGTKREDDIAIELRTSLTKSELHLFLHGNGYSYSDGGALKEFGQRGDCSAGGDVTGGFSSFVKIDSASRLVVLRVDAACNGGSWQARCELWTIESGLSQAGVCSLPPKLDAKSLHATGWK